MDKENKIDKEEAKEKEEASKSNYKTKEVDTLNADTKEDIERLLEEIKNRSRDLNKREMTLDLTEKLQEDLKDVDVEFNSNLVDKFINLIDFSSRDTINNSYSSLLELIKVVSSTSNKPNTGYSPMRGTAKSIDPIKSIMRGNRK